MVSRPKPHDLRGSDKPGSNTPAKTNAGEGKAMDAADEHRPGAGYPAGVVRPADYTSKPGQVQPDLSGTGGSTTKVSPSGIVQKGLTLGGINQLYASLNEAGKMSKGDLPEANKFLSEALPVSGIDTEQTEFELVDRDPVSGKQRTSGVDFKGESEAFETPGDDYQPLGTPKTMPGTTGGNPEDPQDGASEKPDRVERLRQLPFARNSRDGMGRSEAFGGEEPDDSS